MKLSKLEHVFITHSNWLNIGGLPGLALTVQDVGVPNIELHGPKGIVSVFIVLQNIILTIYSIIFLYWIKMGE